MNRNEQMKKLYISGLNYEQIANHFGITKQRVGQILAVGKNGIRRPTVQDPMQRFFDKVKKTSNCWLWLGGKTPHGYGRFWDGEQVVYAHRYSFSLIGALIDGLEIDHLCRNRACVNPDHLEQVDHKTNVYRSPKHIVHGDYVGRRGKGV